MLRSLNKITILPYKDYKGYWIDNYILIYFNENDYFKFIVNKPSPSKMPVAVDVLIKDSIATVPYL
jgi:hypothetical protein